MREFLRGWRRKLGCVTLVAACTVTVFWLRSFVHGDEIALTLCGRSHSFGSELGQLSWWTWRDLQESPLWSAPRIRWDTWQMPPAHRPHGEKIAFAGGIDLGFPNRAAVDWQEIKELLRISGAAIDDSNSISLVVNPSAPAMKWSVSHQAIVTTLTLLSTYLLVWRPRKREAKLA